MGSGIKRLRKLFGWKVEEPTHREFNLFGAATDSFCDNAVHTSRYNFLSFIPINLLIQFTKPANIYFLLISILQVIPSISLTGAMPTVAIPLTIVVVVNMIKDGIEDYKRHVSDEKENSQLVLVASGSDGSLVERKWKHVRVGDVVALPNYSLVPADLVVMATSTSTGIAVIETSNLDGETNLKLKAVPKEFLSFGLSGAASMSEASSRLLSTLNSAHIKCELPNNALYQFQGSFSRDAKTDLENSGRPISLGAQHVMLRGCKLRNTEWMLGAVVYTGHETKIQMNSRTAPRKISALERLTGRFFFIAFWIQLVFCIIGAGVWGGIAISDKFRAKEYLGFSAYTTSQIAGKAVLKFFSYMILFSNFIPISLTVTVALVKMLQALLIAADRAMARSAIVRSSDLNEELGQIDVVFSDKTGTLTKNRMEFRKICVSGSVFGQGLTEIRRNVLKRLGQEVPVEDVPPSPTSLVPHVNFVDERVGKILASKTPSDQYTDLVMFFFALAVNHSVMIETDAEGNRKYSASSPDEGALTYGAKHFGFEFIARDPRGLVVRFPDNQDRFIEQFAVFDFDSDRKRSSLVCRCVDPRDGVSRNFLFIKGADSVIVPLLATGSRDSDGVKKMLAEMQNFALDGLRTLCVGFRELTDDVARDWLDRYRHASASMEGREAQLAALAAEVECDLELAGISAIEDKLQDAVSETIDGLRGAGIKVWMLTGDKLETAVNIGLATSLINASGMYKAIFDSSVADWSSDFLHEQLIQTRAEFRQVLRVDDPTAATLAKASDASEVALVVEGASLERIFKSETTKFLFGEIACMCASVICCRVTPEQKGAVVRLMRERFGKITLAIGDGANDCNMIQSADVGIGIKGVEGLQAFNACDYGLTEFRHLGPLLLVHGRWAYRRLAKLILYMFYKNVVIGLPSYWLNVTTSLFSGQRLFEEFMYQLFNVLFTALPVIVFGVFEQDINRADCMAFPQLYRVGPEKGHANTKIFYLWLATGFWHSLCVFYVPYLAMAGANIVNGDGIPSDLWLFGTIVYLCIVVVVNVKLLLESFYLNALLIYVVFVSVGMWFLTLYVMEVMPLPFSSSGASVEGVNLAPSLAGVSQRLYTSPMTFFIVFATCVTALLRDFIFKAFRFRFRTRDYHVVMASVNHVLKHEKKGAYSPEKRNSVRHQLQNLTVFTESDPNGQNLLKGQTSPRQGSPRPSLFKGLTINPTALNS